MELESGVVEVESGVVELESGVVEVVCGTGNQGHDLQGGKDGMLHCAGIVCLGDNMEFNIFYRCCCTLIRSLGCLFC